MARPLTRPQALQNAAFLRILRRTGNVRHPARECGVAYGTIQHRRAGHPAFAQRWDAALASAQARLHAAGGIAGPRSRQPEARPLAGLTEGGGPTGGGGSREAGGTAPPAASRWWCGCAAAPSRCARPIPAS